jgi:hypothetical protein
VAVNDCRYQYKEDSMMCDAYIGYVDFDQSFQWEGGDWNGNIPKRQSPFSPGGGFRTIKARIASGEYEGKKTDWGSWVAKVTKRQIFDFVEYIHDGGKEFVPGGNYGYDWQCKAYQDLVVFVDELEDGKLYYLVACESY